ncbi:UDP-glucose 4-epimerase GalE [Rhizocola hellebori]|uniref:UDP-glucose 4-epimerase n=1 Tax=Rhizocola hellebori TaxID=1392758 RepID=A0A8J3VK13_9ACTN|nr:UDP-glucose 4-epimerase GalE [Rhizocola hellebori]GIH09057.1 UDP-glucose 4-epimerase GalE [Rhizocola hellebori]
MKVLVTGGAGFIGSTVCSAMIDNGHTPVIVDSLVTGRRDFTAGRHFYEGDIADGTLIDQIFAEHSDIAAVVHCAALIVVPESVKQPLRYYRENVSKTVSLLEHMIRNDCRQLLFSSSASIYRPGADFSVDEHSPIEPTSPYAHSKAMIDGIIAACAAAGELEAVSLRYFNPIGADPQLRTGLQTLNPTHALGKMIEAWENGTVFPVTGADWPTRDGTGIRDYIHVWDLARAHVHAITRLPAVLSASQTSGYQVINLGTGTGTTVRELLDAFSAVIGEPLASQEVGRRPGDAVGAFARSERSAQLLGWRPERSLADGIRDALTWRARLKAML